MGPYWNYVTFVKKIVENFTLAMIWGVMIGTYSSIFVASAFLTFFNLRRTREEEKEDLNYFNNEWWKNSNGWSAWSKS